MWTKFEEERELLKTTRENKTVLPQIKLEEDIIFTTNLKEVCEEQDLLIIAIPLAFFDDTMK